MARTGAPKKATRSREPKWERAFLSSYANTGNVTLACRAAKVGRRTPYHRRERSDEFKAAWEHARQEAADTLEAEAMRRAVEGVADPVYYRGKIVGAVQRYSDTLLIFLLKGARPEKFRERHDVRIEHVSIDELDREILRLTQQLEALD